MVYVRIILVSIMKSKYNKENITNVSSYGIDIEDEIIKALSEELTKNIDAEILKNIMDIDIRKLRKDSINKIFKSSE